MSVNYEEIIALVKQADDIIFDEKALSHVEEKGLADYVTYVDLGVQHFLQRELAARYPEIAFMGEEDGENQLHPEGSCWILDPIDGTTNLIHHYNCSAISLGLWEKGQIIFGVVYNPFTKEIWTATRGGGAFYNGKKIAVSKAQDMGHCLLAFGTGPYQKELADENFRKLKSIYMVCQDLRRSGSAAIDLCYVASGKTEGFFEIALKPWDYAAGSIILEEAGGVITNWKGEPVTFDRGGTVCSACCKKIQDELLELLK
ncbi:MAG: inositol monophosphatase [Lachnospiraceae bacterium]|nr:inositol monophosphatase [Lachnospiraceae bacterium]